MFITGLGTATPARRYTQRECREAAQAVEVFSRLRACLETMRGAVFGEKAGWRDEGGAARGHHRATPKAFASRPKPDGLFPRAASGSPSSPREERVGRGPRRGETNRNAPPLHSPLLHPMEEREKSRSLMQPGLFRENPPGGGSFVRGRRWFGRHSPLRGAARGQGRLGRRQNLSPQDPTEFSNRLQGPCSVKARGRTCENFSRPRWSQLVTTSEVDLFHRFIPPVSTRE